MTVQRGTFIVLEGVDGSGKSTQFRLLEARLRQAGYDVVTFDFPQYDQPSSYFVREYLAGKYGDANAIGPYTSSLFYALDRFEAAPAIHAALDAGKIVLADRFTGSSMAHQGTKFRSPEERRGYFIWLDNLEFEMLKIPRPDLSFVLRAPPEISQMLLEQSGKARDAHEKDPRHLEHALAVYDDMTQLFPKDFQRIDCVRGDTLMEIEAIQSLLWEKISPLLPPPSQLEMPMPTLSKAEATASPQIIDAAAAEKMDAYYTPDSLDDDVKRQYKLHMEAIIRLQADMHKSIGTYLKEQGRDPHEADDLLAGLTPLAVYAAEDSQLREHIEQGSLAALTKLTQDTLPSQHAASTDAVQLSEVWPRNEFDLIPDMLYGASNLPLADLRAQTNIWPYTRKLDVMETYLKSSNKTAFQKIRYTWDILSDYVCYKAVSEHFTITPPHQQLTPRYGYDMPDEIDAAGLTDQFELGFAASLELYSFMQQAGLELEAQYAVLAGHRMRWKTTISATELLETGLASTNSAIRPLLNTMREKLGEVHPMLAEAMYPPSTTADSIPDL